MEISRIGSVQSLGFARIPIWMEGIHYEEPLDTEYLIRINIEVHPIPNFSHGVLIGVDTIKDYGIDFLISKNLASMGEFIYQVTSANSKFRLVLVRLKNDVTVHGRTCRCIPITSHMMPDVDYVFEPQQFLQPRHLILPSLSLPFAIIITSVKELMFQNSLITPMVLRKRQVIGRATMSNSPTIVDAGFHIDWIDLIQPGPRRLHPRLVPPQFVSQTFYMPGTPSGQQSPTFVDNHLISKKFASRQVRQVLMTPSYLTLNPNVT